MQSIAAATTPSTDLELETNPSVASKPATVTIATTSPSEFSGKPYQEEQNNSPKKLVFPQYLLSKGYQNLCWTAWFQYLVSHLGYRHKLQIQSNNFFFGINHASYLGFFSTNISIFKSFVFFQSLATRFAFRLPGYVQL